MYLPPWLAASLAAFNLALNADTSIPALTPLPNSRPEPVYMIAQGDGGDRFMTVREVRKGATAELVNTAPTAWVWIPRTHSRPDHVRIHANGSDPALCLAAPVDATGTPKAGDLELVPCDLDLDVQPHTNAGHASRDPALWTQTPEPAGTASFHLPKGLFLGHARSLVAATNNYEWSSVWVGMSVA